MTNLVLVVGIGDDMRWEDAWKNIVDFDKNRKVVIAVGIAVLVAAFTIIAFARFELATGHETIEVVSGQPSEQASAASNDVPTEKEVVFVHVAGAVTNPGVYELEQGCRVVDALNAAGGCNDEAVPSALNLARVLVDGEQVYVPTNVELEGQGNATSVSGDAGQGATSRVNVNTASAQELATLPGIGPETAKRIVSDRAANGPFATLDDLTRVNGIGQKKVDSLRDSATV